MPFRHAELRAVARRCSVVPTGRSSSWRDEPSSIPTTASGTAMWGHSSRLTELPNCGSRKIPTSDVARSSRSLRQVRRRRSRDAGNASGCALFRSCLHFRSPSPISRCSCTTALAAKAVEETSQMRSADLWATIGCEPATTAITSNRRSRRTGKSRAVGKSRGRPTQSASGRHCYVRRWRA